MFCPQCRSEYREGFTECTTCHVPLVADKPGKPPDGHLTEVNRYINLPDALLAKSILDSAEIDNFLFDENIVRLDWFLSNAVGNVKLMADAEDREFASDLLAQLPADQFETDAGTFIQPRCPNCASANVTHGHRGKRTGYATVGVGVPLPVGRWGWKCESCGHEWNDSKESE